MPSEFAQQIVDRIFADEKALAIDATNDALSATTYELIQQKKLEFAKSMGFDLGDTAQDSADEIEDSLADVSDSPEDVEIEGRMPHDPPEETTETEDTEDETDR